MWKLLEKLTTDRKYYRSHYIVCLKRENLAKRATHRKINETLRLNWMPCTLLFTDDVSIRSECRKLFFLAMYFSRFEVVWGKYRITHAVKSCKYIAVRKLLKVKHLYMQLYKCYWYRIPLNVQKQEKNTNHTWISWSHECSIMASTRSNNSCFANQKCVLK